MRQQVTFHQHWYSQEQVQGKCCNNQRRILPGLLFSEETRRRRRGPSQMQNFCKLTISQTLAINNSTFVRDSISLDPTSDHSPTFLEDFNFCRVDKQLIVSKSINWGNNLSANNAQESSTTTPAVTSMIQNQNPIHKSYNGQPAWCVPFFLLVETEHSMCNNNNNNKLAPSKECILLSQVCFKLPCLSSMLNKATEVETNARPSRRSKPPSKLAS